MTGLDFPRALLLDFGGVIVQSTSRPGWVGELAGEVAALLRRAGQTGLTVADIERDILAGTAADSAWKDAMSRVANPAELTCRMFWSDFVAVDWPEPARALVTSQAWMLCRRKGELSSDRHPRPGLTDLLKAAREWELPVVVVSNALSGVVHRDWIRTAGLEEFVAFQIYSDEVGIRKPNPEMIGLACRALDISPALAWYVGDNFDRDVVCGRRAGVGATVLMNARGTYDVPFVVAEKPDAVVDDPAGLLALLRDAAAGREDPR